MNKLWTFGDSFTYNTNCNPGDEYYEKYKKENDKTWTELVAEYYNLELKNFGVYGCSNDIIIDILIDQFGNIQKNDLVVIEFTFSWRFDVPNNNSFVSVSNHFIKKTSNDIISFYTQEQLESIINFQYHFAQSDLYKQRQLKRFNFIVNLLKERGIKVCFWKLLEETENKFNRIQKQTKNKIRDGHFSYDGHKEFFTYIKSKLEPKDKFI